MSLLTIGIPTYNRSIRLEKSFRDLLEQILDSRNKIELCVYVSNNGSTDNTNEIIEKYAKIFISLGIPFYVNVFSENKGFDVNVFSCYKNCTSEYIWFLSDDDNINDGAIDIIIEDIKQYAPSVLYYNFDQFPYNVANPNVSETVLYKNVDEDSMDSLSKIIEWPKLSSLVIVKGGIEDFGENFKTGFMHIALAIQSGFDYGNVFHSKMFICRPDDDYMNHIEFPPYIMNGLVEMVEQIFYQNNRTELMKYVDIKAVDPLIVSLNVFGSYFRGKYALNQELKKQMKKTVKEEFYNFKISRLYKKDFYLSILKFAISYIYNVIFRAGK